MFSLYFNTIRYLKLKQVFYRILFQLLKPNINKSTKFKIRIFSKKFCYPIQKKSTLLINDTFHFLNKSRSLSEIGWSGRSKSISKLWRYNQHYFDYLITKISFKNRELLHQLIEKWIKENKFSKGEGWDPYPTSLRIVNWIKFNFLSRNLSYLSIKSLFLQSKWLNKRIEWHILGNHLFSNAKALIFSGLFFSNKESEIWLRKGLKIIDKELSEQVLRDGGCFELSPMYHAILIEDILDLINISNVYPKKIKEKYVKKWKKTVKKMLKWLDVMKHPDGKIPFFNDAALEIAPNLEELKKYSKRLGIYFDNHRFKKTTHLQFSGYLRINTNEANAILDVARIGPDYLPGHAHADTLSFELSLFGKRFLVNGGTSEYGNTLIRKYERSTKAHNTVVIDNENSSQVWNSFRVAKRAFPYGLKIKEFKNFVSVNCAHDGYKRLEGKPVHRRNWQFFQSSLIIRDYIEGSYKSANAYFHFHPSVSIVRKSKNIFNLKIVNGKKIILQINRGNAKIENSYYSPEFGKRLKTRRLKVTIDKKFNESNVEVIW